MAAAETLPTAAPNKGKRHIAWDAPASQTVPQWTDDRTLRQHARILVDGGRTLSSVAADIGISGTSLTYALKKTGLKRAAQPKPAPTPATGGGTVPTLSPRPDPQPAPTPLPAVPPSPVGRGAGEAGGVGTSADWSAARDLIAGDPDMAAEFLAAYDLTDKLDAFRVGFVYGRRTAAAV